MFRKLTLACVATTATLLLVGCASRGQVAASEQRINARLDQLSGQLEKLEDNSNRSLQRAEAAEAEARRSAARADDAARTADAIFAKRVVK